MHITLKAFLEAAKETPRLYFAPLKGMIRTARRAQDAMVNSHQNVILRAKTTDKAFTPPEKGKLKTK